MATVNRKAYQKLRLREFNTFDVERTLRENIYELEVENNRIEQWVYEMLQHKIPVSIILRWMQQMENNAAEIVYITSLAQHDLSRTNLDTSIIRREG